jgi:hypothetical protein
MPTVLTSGNYKPNEAVQGPFTATCTYCGCTAKFEDGERTRTGRIMFQCPECPAYFSIEA